MILHFSHIGLTDGRTFMIPFGSVTSELALEAAAGRRYHSRTRARTRVAHHAQTSEDSKPDPASRMATGGRPRGVREGA
jgi:hypothetical protein